MKTIKIIDFMPTFYCPKEVDSRIYNYIQIYRKKKSLINSSFFIVSKIGIGIFSGFLIGFLSYRFVSNNYIYSSNTSSDKTNSDIISITKGIKQIDYINSQL